LFFLNLFDEEDVMLLFLATGAPGGTVGDNGEDVEHAEEDTETSAEDECNGSSLPFTEHGESDQEALSEGSSAQETERTLFMVRAVEMVMMVVRMFVVMGARVVGDSRMLILEARHVLNHDWALGEERKDVHFLFFNLLVLEVMVHFNHG
jgi:hypothetical protein